MGNGGHSEGKWPPFGVTTLDSLRDYHDHNQQSGVENGGRAGRGSSSLRFVHV